LYAVFHSPTYRERYKEFLKIDFPRLPLTSNKELFAQLSEIGQELVDLHLMKSDKLNDSPISFPVQGINAVDTVSFDGNKVWINGTQYF
jgi:predicted helicase